MKSYWPTSGKNEDIAIREEGQAPARAARRDLAFIEQREVSRGEPDLTGAYAWVMKAPSGEWPFGLNYQASVPHYFEMFTICHTKAKEILENFDPFAEACSANGLQGFTRSSSDSRWANAPDVSHVGLTKHSAIVGAKLCLKAESLSAALFNAVTARLEETTRQALARY
jgi:hypothetical protein